MRLPVPLRTALAMACAGALASAPLLAPVSASASAERAVAPRAAAAMPHITAKVTKRGINRQACFHAKADYEYLLHHLVELARRYECEVHAYVLMTNHFHLLLTPHLWRGASLMMKLLGQRYAQYINRTHRRSGTMWDGRFHSSLVEDARYVLACYRYIETNPVRAHMTMAASDYRWSSYHANGGGKVDSLVRPHAAYAALDLDPECRTRAYAQLCSQELPTKTIDEIRRAIKIGGAIGARRRKRGRPAKLNEKNGVRPHLFGVDQAGSG